jgi:hypothetical protein
MLLCWITLLTNHSYLTIKFARARLSVPWYEWVNNLACKRTFSNYTHTLNIEIKPQDFTLCTIKRNIANHFEKSKKITRSRILVFSLFKMNVRTTKLPTSVWCILAAHFDQARAWNLMSRNRMSRNSRELLWAYFCQFICGGIRSAC